MRDRFLEQLERRRLLSASLDASGVLRVVGAAANDDIQLTLISGALRVTQNGQPPSDFPLTSVTSIDVRGLAGDDAIALASPIVIASLLDGGPGRDRITGGTGVDTLDGDEGNDAIYGQDGDDSLFGGEQDDIVYGGAGNDIMHGGENVPGEAFEAEFGPVYGRGGFDRLYGEDGDDDLNGG